MGPRRADASCCHHLRVERLGAGLGSPHGPPTAEGLELPGLPGWFTPVQWHPKDTAHEGPAQQGRFHALVRTARDGGRRGP
ncbi:hypothetical protein [Streptomyces sp. Root369]|uniref:hypothetical protein n=1 Tax=Streptomyces sp. Root369 TaxID=1736523 RepID=UPI00070AA94B|nr:hypothetical protein [Streptomyces sp. Root369]KQW13333.1 hypothetical protein ASD08_32765 [Streptomyces sp. Root369]